jgi:hypothetical protein
MKPQNRKVSAFSACFGQECRNLLFDVLLVALWAGDFLLVVLGDAHD